MKNKILTKSIYIIKNDINNKVYIGQTVNPKQRWEQYKTLVRKNPNAQLISKAMSKYGIEHFWMEIIATNVVNYNEREIELIKEYNSITPNGYNVAIGGEGVGNGINHPNSSIKDEKILEELVDELIQDIVPLTELSKKYSMSYTQLEELNYGRTYFNPSLNYPLRNTKKYSEEKLKQITYSLKYELDKTLHEISEEYEIDYSFLNDINQGKSYYRSYLQYPLRLGKMKLAEINYPVIKDLLKNSSLSQKEIAQKFNLSQQTISDINVGKKGYDKLENYPLRINKGNNFNHTCLSPSLVQEISELIKESDLSLKKISEQFEVPYSTVQNINRGQIKKYRNDDKYTYPLRKK